MHLAFRATPDSCQPTHQISLYCQMLRGSICCYIAPKVSNIKRCCDWMSCYWHCSIHSEVIIICPFVVLQEIASITCVRITFASVVVV